MTPTNHRPITYLIAASALALSTLTLWHVLRLPAEPIVSALATAVLVGAMALLIGEAVGDGVGR